MIVVGGGVIGVEYTCMFAALGVRVILVEKRPRLLEFADSEMVEALSYNLRDHRVTLRLNEEVESVEETAGRHRGGEAGEQEETLGRRLAVRGGPAGQRRRTEPGGGGRGSRRARPHQGRLRISHRAAAHLRGGRRDRISRAWHRSRWSKAASPRPEPSARS